MNNELSLEQILDQEQGRLHFTNYLRDCHNEESLLFLQRVEEFSTLKSSGNRHQKAREIIHMFILEESTQELNISTELRTRTETRFTEECTVDNCPKTFFDECVHFVMLQLKEDVLPRFLTTKHCEEYVNRSRPVMTESKKNIDLQELTPFVSLDALDQVKSWAFSDEIMGTQWKKVQQKKDCTAYVSKKGVQFKGGTDGTVATKKLKMSKLVGYLPFPVDTVVKAAAYVECRHASDQSLIKTKHLRYHPANESPTGIATTLTAEFYSMGPLLSSRYFTFAGTIIEETIPGTAWRRVIFLRKSVNKTVDYSSFLKQSAIRADCIGAWIFEQCDDTGERTKYYECAWLDLKGSIKPWLWNLLITARGTSFHDGLVKSCKKVRTNAFTSTENDNILKTLEEYRANKQRGAL